MTSEDESPLCGQGTPMLTGFSARLRQTGSAVRILQALIVLSLIAPAAVLVFVTLQSRTLLLDNATRRATRMAEMLAQHASSTFDGYNVAFGRIEEHLLHSEGMPQENLLHEYLGTIDREMKSVDGIFMIDENGMAAVHSRYFPLPKTYVGDRDYIRDLYGAPSEQDRAGPIRGRDGFAVGTPIRSRFSGKVVLVVARARKAVTGPATSALVIAVSQGYFEEFYATLALAAGDRVALLRADSRVLAQIPPAPGRPSVDPDAPQGPSFVAQAAADPGLARTLSEGSVDDVSSTDGVRRISGFRKLDGYPVFVEVGFSVDTVLAPWRQRILINLVVTGLVTLLLVGLARLALVKTRAEAQSQQLVLDQTRQRAEAEAALRQSQKMEALGQLTGGIAHDFNNLLNVVLINLELAAKRLSDSREPGAPPSPPDKLDGYIRGATQGAERGVALTRRLLAYAHRQDAEPVAVHVAELVLGFRDMLGQAVGSQVRITLDCPRTLPPVHVDPNELETALLNLVVNARDAMPDGGRVHIAAREERGPKTGDAAPERTVVVGVKDTGRGMDDAMRARATEPFYTTKERGKGSGLGLAMVERFAAHAGGRLRIDSRPGDGTSVEIWLPAAGRT